ncbi:MAG: bifunctional phosphoribosylaminoimidazolecarboxamide formyltransferase/IMP cyclohydrolase, partial [Candidatus Obscuribacterales bacterium]|nr:bifunctional phosphoribosylaminoimidazolecarboxamide formyltransferase/IMP cyclohydrolase [Candidatus Obscuribacterales bacterium]
LNLKQFQSLRYGENPHQSAIWYSVSENGNGGSEPDFPPFEQIQGKEMSSNNLVDTFALTTFLKELHSPAVCIIKHNNPCGIAEGKTLAEAFEKALSTDPISAFGGIFGFTEEVDAPLIDEMLKGFVEIVAAPSFTSAALERLSKKKNVRVLKYKTQALSSNTSQNWKVRDLQDFGWILEKADEPPVRPQAFKLATGEARSDLDKDIAFAWNVVKHLTSNAIFLAKDGKSLGFGIGQTSRIASVKIALEQAGEDARGAVMASDAFFPATDNIDAAAEAGISVIVQPGGSIKDEEVLEACKKHGITMLLTGQRCFKH